MTNRIKPATHKCTGELSSFSLCIIMLYIFILHAYPANAENITDLDFSQGYFANRGVVEEYLNVQPLSPVEGIWEYPADEVALLVIANPDKKGNYGIFYVEGIDCRLMPGMKLGWLEETPSSSKFKITLCSHLNKGLPGTYQEGLATLSDREDALLIEMPKIKISFNPSIVLPVLWNKLRLNLRIKSSNPLDKLPEGWIKTYPSYDSNGSYRNRLRYL